MVVCQEEEALKDQDLSNALADTNWAKAVQLAFELRRPFKVLNVFADLLRFNFCHDYYLFDMIASLQVFSICAVNSLLIVQLMCFINACKEIAVILVSET